MASPSFANYAGLVAAVPNWAGRGDPRFLALVPDFIALGESRIFQTGDNLLRVRDMIVSVSLPIPVGLNYATLPADLLAFYKVSAPGQPLVEYMPADQLADLPTPGDPGKYSLDGNSFYYGQANTGVSTIQLSARYYQNPGNLSAALSTWLLQKAPQTYLYAALLEGALWAKNATKAGEFGQLLNKTIDGLHSADKALQISGGRLRMTRP